MKLLVHGLDMMVKAHYSMTCVVINILVAPKGVAAARSANACIRHWLCPRPSWGTYILRPRVQALPGQQGSVPQPSWGTFTPDPVFNFKPTRAPWLSLDAAGGLS